MASNQDDKDAELSQSGGMLSFMRELVSDLLPYSDRDVAVKQESLRERDRYHIVKTIESTLREVGEEEEFFTRRVVVRLGAVVCFVVGVLLVVWGFSLTPLFSSYQRNYILVGIGFALVLPSLAMLYLVLFPRKETVAKLKEITDKQVKRASPTVITDAIKRAQLAADAERKKLAVIAKLNRHEYHINAASMGELVELLSAQSGLPVEQMLVLYNGEVVKICPDKTLEGGYGFLSGDVINFFNKGSYDILLQKSNPKGYKSVAGSTLEQGVVAVNWKGQKIKEIPNMKIVDAIRDPRVHPADNV